MYPIYYKKLKSKEKTLHSNYLKNDLFLTNSFLNRFVEDVTRLDSWYDNLMHLCWTFLIQMFFTSTYKAKIVLSHFIVHDSIIFVNQTWQWTPKMVSKRDPCLEWVAKLLFEASVTLKSKVSKTMRAREFSVYYPKIRPCNKRSKARQSC